MRRCVAVTFSRVAIALVVLLLLPRETGNVVLLRTAAIVAFFCRPSAFPSWPCEGSENPLDCSYGSVSA